MTKIKSEVSADIFIPQVWGLPGAPFNSIESGIRMRIENQIAIEVKSLIRLQIQENKHA